MEDPNSADDCFTNNNTKTEESSHTMDCDINSNKTEAPYFSPLRLTKSHNITDSPGALSHAQSEELLHETKYVMLNFMSLIPPNLYKNHVHPSPDLTKPHSTGSNRFSKSMSFLGKSKSFDVVNLSKTHKQSQLSRAKALDRDLDSPQSEDNVNYRYKQNQISFGHPHGTPNSVNSEIYQHLDETDAIREPEGTSSIEAISSAEGSPRKHSQGVSRLNSDISSCGEYSYFSDADDEYEVSQSSSSGVLSVASVSQTDGLLDLRNSSSVVKQKVARSVSEFDDIDHPKFTQTDTIPEAQDEDNAEVEGERKDNSTDAKATNGDKHDHGDGLDDADGILFSMPGRTTADRSKLKLTIPPQPVVLNDILLSLQSELNSEISELESEFEDGSVLHNTRDAAAPPPPAVTPTQAARTLARIGDEVMEHYSGQITSTVNQLFLYKIGELSYQQFRDISEVMIDKKLPGWRQVALIMVYGQTAAWYAVKGGHKNIGNIVDYCSRFVFDVAAEFIIKEGGWGAVMNFDPSQSSDTQSSVEFGSPTMDYFTSHDVTQVESDPTQNTHNISGSSQHSSHDSDLNPSSNIQTDHNICTQDGGIDGASHLLPNPQGTFMYKPSLGFDFRNVPTPTGTGEGSLKRNPDSSNSLQFVFDNGSIEQFDESAALDTEGNEDVFENDQNNDENHTQNQARDTGDNYQNDDMDSSYSGRHEEPFEDIPSSNPNAKTASPRVGDVMNDDKAVTENNDGSNESPSQAATCDNVRDQDGTLTGNNETSRTNLDEGAKATDDQQESKENNNGGDNAEAVKSEGLLGYLDDRRTKVLLFAGAAAAVGFGLKLFGR